MEEVVRGVTPSGELKSHLTTHTHLRSPTWIILALYSCYMSHIISYPSSAWLEFKETRVCPCGPAITHPETVPFVRSFIDVLFQNEARISHFTLDLFFFFFKSILDVFWRISKFISDQPQPIRFGSIADCRFQENQRNAPIDMLQTLAALSWWSWWWHLLGELTSLLPTKNSRIFFLSPSFC